MDYWYECVAEALEDAGFQATDEQIKTVASWVEGAHENYGMSHGHHCISNPLQSEVDQLKREKKALEDAHDRQIWGIKQGVAQRRHVRPQDVEIDNDGLVTYYP